MFYILNRWYSWDWGIGSDRGDVRKVSSISPFSVLFLAIFTLCQSVLVSCMSVFSLVSLTLSLFSYLPSWDSGQILACFLTTSFLVFFHLVAMNHSYCLSWLTNWSSCTHNDTKSLWLFLLCHSWLNMSPSLVIACSGTFLLKVLPFPLILALPISFSRL